MAIPWKPASQMTHITKNTTRLDGVVKVTGKAKYAYDMLPDKCLIGRFVTCPHPNARRLSIDTSAAKALPGVKAVWVEGRDIYRFSGDFVAAVAAISDDVADDAVTLIADSITWETLPFVVREDDARQPGAPGAHGGDRSNVREATNENEGDVDAAFADAQAVIEGTWSTQVQTHTSLEPHGMVCEWNDAQDAITVWASTQGVFSVREGIAQAVGLDESKVTVLCDYMGGGFGSKFGSRTEGNVCALLAKDAKQAVKLLLTRKQEQTNTGNRPSSNQWIKAAAKDGKLTAFQTNAFGTGGITGGAGFPTPYLYSVPNRRVKRDDVFINAGNQAAMRAPGHPQGSFAMEGVMDELAYKLGADCIEFRINNDPNATRRAQFRDLAERLDWKNVPKEMNADKGTVKRGWGVGAATWGGGGGGTQAEMDIHQDGSVVVRCGTQDIGTGTRTVVAVVAAEQLSLPIDAIQVNIGNTNFPPSGGSGGSTTCASVAPAIKVTADNALFALFERVADAFDTSPDNLEAFNGSIRTKDDPSNSMSWKDACALLGAEQVSVRGQHEGGLSSSGTAAVCGVELTVDTETGFVRVERAYLIQEAGLIINMLTVESQIIGAVIQGISYALYEDRIMDRMLGHQVNPNMEFYKVLGAPDMPHIEPIMWMTEESLARGVIGIGEPPVVPVAGAVANAVRHACGARVYDLPITPWKVLAALEGANA